MCIDITENCAKSHSTSNKVSMFIYNPQSHSFMNYELKITNKIIWDKITIKAEIYGLVSPKKWIRGLLLLYIVVRSKKKKWETQSKRCSTMREYHLIYINKHFILPFLQNSITNTVSLRLHSIRIYTTERQNNYTFTPASSQQICKIINSVRWG